MMTLNSEQQSFSQPGSPDQPPIVGVRFPGLPNDTPSVVVIDKLSIEQICPSGGTTNGSRGVTISS